MYITFLIGNGFDRNLGLDTTYSDFVKYYKTTKCSSQNLKDFRSYINEHEELWSSAEIALGQYTSQFKAGEAAKFAECQSDFCIQLAEYLREQEKRIDYERSSEAILNAFTTINDLIKEFPAVERGILNDMFNRHGNEERIYRFLDYNYTYTLDSCIEAVRKKQPNGIGNHVYLANRYNHTLGELCHVHGTVESNMIFGVHDDTQIANNQLFDCENGDLYKQMLIKKQANDSFLENTDSIAAKVVSESHLIYVYGMSIGETDTLWWSRILTWLKRDNNHHLILHKFEAPSNGVFPLDLHFFWREQKQNFVIRGGGNGQDWKGMDSQIHITKRNVFEKVRGIARSIESLRAEQEAKEFIEINKLANQIQKIS